MSGRLFIELYLDEDVDVLVAELLRARGFVALTTQGAGRLGSNDDEQLSYAISEQKALLTHNRFDFEKRATASYAAGRKHYGIIIATPQYSRIGAAFAAGVESNHGRRNGKPGSLHLRQLRPLCSPQSARLRLLKHAPKDLSEALRT